MTYKIKIFISWVIAVLFLSSCAGLQFKYAALNYAGHVDGIYNSTHTVKIDTLNEFQFRNKIRNDFQFRFDYAQYALSQPRSFDWNNRLLGFRYNRFNRWGSFYNYNYYWSRTQMWHDWAWGYPYTWNDPFWNNSWYYGYSYNNYWNRYNPYLGYNSHYYPNYYYRERTNRNVAYINGRRGSSNVTGNRTNVGRRLPRTATAGNTLSVDEIADDIRVRVNKRRIINNNDDDKTIRSNPRIYLRPESGSNGRRGWSRENVPVKPVKPIITPPSQPRQIRGGQRSSGVQQSISRGSTSGQRGGGTVRQRN